MPFTKDIGVIKQGVKTMQTADRFYARGSTPNIALDNVLKVLKSSKEKERQKKNIVFH